MSGYLVGLYFEKHRMWGSVYFEVLVCYLSFGIGFVSFYPELKLEKLRRFWSCYKSLQASKNKSRFFLHHPSHTLLHRRNNNHRSRHPQHNFFTVFSYCLFLVFRESKREMSIHKAYYFNNPVQLIIISFVFWNLNLLNDLFRRWCIIFIKNVLVILLIFDFDQNLPTD